MVRLKIAMNNGKEYKINSFIAKEVKDFLINALMPNGVQLIWYEILPGEFIQVNQIQNVKIITDEEFEKMNRVISIEDKKIENEESEEITEE